MTIVSDRPIYRISIIILIIIYMVGLVGFLSPYKNLMIDLTPYTLLLSLLLLLINQTEWDRFLFLFIFSIMITGYLVEVIGVKTGILFGEYQYDRALGFKVLDVPPLIGVNWFLLVFSSGMISKLFGISRFFKVVFAAALMVILDLSLEPVAMQYDFWSWKNDHVPLLNYGSWFVISLIFQALFQRLELKQLNRFSIILFIVQWVFFLTLSLAINIS
jgi:putative membrane protein